MELIHFHIGIKDLPAAIVWFNEKAGLDPIFQNEKLACFKFGPITTVLDQSSDDHECTLAFETANCNDEYNRFLQSGAETISSPSSKPWGVFSAYIKGPGNITIELEEINGN